MAPGEVKKRGAFPYPSLPHPLHTIANLVQGLLRLRRRIRARMIALDPDAYWDSTANKLVMTAKMPDTAIP